MAAQPAWSDLPLILFSAVGMEDVAYGRHAAQLARLGNVTLLERPAQPRTLLTAVASALRARKRQYAARAEIQNRDNFLAMLGHELRNPLAAVVLAAELGAKADAGSEDVAKRCEVILRHSRHLSRLVDDLLDVARVTTGKLMLQIEPIDLRRTLQLCEECMGARAKDHGISLQIALPPQSVMVMGDAVRLEQVFNNLIANSIKYTGRGGTIVAHLDSIGGKANVRISDNGIGLAPDVLPRVFDLFSQAEDSLDRSQGGLGVGLTIVRSLVELHGGVVIAQSEGLGRGSEFVVTLDVMAEGTSALERETKRAPVVSTDRSLEMVVIDDNRDILESLAELLADVGYRVHTAEDGIAGVQLILSVRPSVALIDIGLPGLDGYQVAERVRAAGGDPIFLVALTGYGQPEDRQRALAAGFDGHLTKPIDLEAVEAVVHRLFNSKVAAAS